MRAMAALCCFFSLLKNTVNTKKKKYNSANILKNMFLTAFCFSYSVRDKNMFAYMFCGGDCVVFRIYAHCSNRQIVCLLFKKINKINSNSSHLKIYNKKD